MKNKEIKLYNMIIPPVWAATFSILPWTVSIIGNLIIDTGLLVILNFIIHKRFDKEFFIRNFIIVWLFGFLADIIGWFACPFCGFVFILFDKLLIRDNEIITVEQSFWICKIFALLVASAMIFIFDYFVVFKKSKISKKQRLMCALSYAIITAPYSVLFLNNYIFQESYWYYTDIIPV